MTSATSRMEGSTPSIQWQPSAGRYPSFMLLSVSSTASAATDAFVAENLCFLPAQDFVYAWYAVLLVISIVALFSWPAQGLDVWPTILRACAACTSIGAVKEKDEDTEWEMLWDAEGGMHLISKGHSRNEASQSSESRRGNAVQRAAAKARAAEAATAVTLSESSETGSSNKSKMLSLRGRIIQMAGPLVLLLTVNLSLYMILVTKDWT